MKKLLITGSNGQLGSDCFNFFSELDEKLEVVGIDLPLVDLTKKTESFNFLNQFKPDVIINCAAYTAVDNCEDDLLCWKCNEDIPNNLSLWSSSNNAYLIHISTDYVFNGKKKKDNFWLENDTTCPLSEYGKSKLAGEQIIQKNMNNFSIIRTAWLYGINGDNFLKKILKLSYQKQKIHLDEKNNRNGIKVVSDQFGSPTSTESLVKQIKLIIDKRLNGIIHATSEGYCSWYDFAEASAKEMNIKSNFIPCSTEEFITKAKRPKNSILENYRLKDNNINSFLNWKNELKSFIEKHKEDLKTEIEKQ